VIFEALALNVMDAAGALARLTPSAWDQRPLNSRFSIVEEAPNEYAASALTKKKMRTRFIEGMIEI
jgi:hypothetical protein